MLNLAEGDEFLEALWDRREHGGSQSVKTLGPAGIPSLSNAEMRQIDEIVEEEVPGLKDVESVECGRYSAAFSLPGLRISEHG